MKSFTRFYLAGFLAITSLTALPSFSHAIGFNIGWTGSGGYSMTGMFSYSDALINTGAIDETQIDTLMIDVLLNGVSQGTWNMADGQGAGALAFNFNFNTTTETFLVGGLSPGLTGQRWNFMANPGVGFISGNSAQSVNIDGTSFGSVSITLRRLTATRKTAPPIPEPSTFLLFGTGMLGLLGYAARRKRQGQIQTTA